MAALDPELDATPRRHTARWVAIALGVVLALLVYLLATRDPASTRLAQSPLVGRAVPPLAGESLLDGDRFDIGTQTGRWVLVNFFATWCVPCVSEHDDLATFAAAHAEPGDARVVSVVFDDDPADVTAFFEERGGDWPVLGNDGRVTVDFGVTGVPESFLVAPNGVVWGKIVGGVEASRLESILERAKAEMGQT